MSHVLIPGTCEYVASRGKMNFAYMIKNLEVGGDSGLFRWAQCHYKSPSKREREAGQSGFVIQCEKGVAGHRRLVLKTEGAMCQGTRQSLDVGKDKKIDSALESPERTLP